ncbi:ABC transporter permease [Streptomyces melanosporofaciens]|uniref:Putative ABC transport system permease protein n=1 Tax=Streptomyces melanosporofaciens TaxID=67327 RepID=A0A1H4RVM2_STRMJ|nr:ABC transporter permease [Streptomyces melanosporofaciens]SEC35641.1 putative ABC transport system permease protein [Streptomyces melanosporofaciens]
MSRRPDPRRHTAARLTAARLTPRRLSPADTLRVGSVGLRTRPTRVLLSALGIAIGIAAMVAVVAVSASSQAAFNAQLASVGTNMLTVTPGKDFVGDPAPLPENAADMVGHIAPVENAAATGSVKGAKVYRNDRIPKAASRGIGVLGAGLGLPRTVGLHMAAGTWLNGAQSRYPAVVLGTTAAENLGITTPGAQIWLGEQWFTVTGILQKAPLAPELDSAALIGWDAAKTHLGFDGRPTMIYTRTADSKVDQVRGVLAATVNPEAPNEVTVSRPSDALSAKQAANRAFTGLLVGIGAIALLVGGVGVANTMVIAVLERRGEIGLRRALGATRGQIRTQFLTESVMLSALGGISGAALGAGASAGYALSQNWQVVVPPWALGVGVGATMAIGALAGLWPAVRAARLAPRAALSGP